MLNELADPQTPLFLPLKTLRENFCHDPYAVTNDMRADASLMIRRTAIYRTLRRTADWMDNLRDANDLQEDYDWRADYENWKHIYQEEIFLDSRSAAQSGRAMARHDECQRDRTAQSEYPVTNFLLNCIGLGADLSTFRRIPFIGGLGESLGVALGKFVPQASILRDMVAVSTAAALDMGEADIARTLASDFETFVGNAVEIAKSVAMARLLAAQLEVIRGRGLVRTLQEMQRRAVPQESEIITAEEQKLLRTIFSGGEVEISGGGYLVSRATMTEDIENATTIVDGPARPLAYDEKANLEDILGKIPTKGRSNGSAFSIWLNRAIGSHVVQSQSSNCPITREISARIADSRQHRLDEAGI
jgi:hypothetical protein